MRQVFELNTFLPIRVLSALMPVIKRSGSPKIAVLSARVGSISDNRLGGWYSYRGSKAALNMATKNMANEFRRSEVVAVALHPGTTDTDLSKPFQKGVRPEKLFSVEYTSGMLLDVLQGLTPEDSGGFFAYDGSKIEY